MSYCVAWKYNNSVFMLADTATSSLVGTPLTNYNSMGEKQTVYDNYLIQENLLKLITINDNLAVAFATDDTNVADEMIQTISFLYKTVDFNTLLKNFTSTYGTNKNTELLLIHSTRQNNAQIYKFCNGLFSTHEYADIGSGTQTKTLSEDMKLIIKMYENDHYNDSNYYLALVASTLQCYLFHNDYFKHGIGGIVTGLYLNSRIKFCRDLEFYFFQNDINKGDSLSVINRYHSFFSSSKLGKQRGYINPVDAEIIEDEYNVSGIIKSLDTKNPFYYIFYCNDRNVMIFLETNGKLHNYHFSRYIRRDLGQTDYS